MRAAAILLLLAAGRVHAANLPGADAPASGAQAPSAAAPAAEAPAEPAQGRDSGRRDFLEAMLRFHQYQKEPPDSPALQSYVLYDYLTAARLRRRLILKPDDALDTEIDGFLQSRGSQPVTRSLRRDWLASLAARKRWAWFLPRSVDASDAQLACDRLAGRLATGDEAGLAQEALARWTTPQQPPEECRPVFDWLRAQGLLTPVLAETRTRAALAADNARLAREFVADVPEPLSGPLLLWIQLLDAPKATAALLSLDPDRPVEPEALVAGFNKLGIIDNAAASALLPALLKRGDMTPALRVRLQRAVAVGAAKDRDPNAVADFASVPIDPADVQGLEWRVRAALWAGDFATALGWIGEMPPTLATQPRWRYWRARAVAATSGAAAAAPLFEDIAGMRDYYGYLAADRLNRAYRLNDRPTPDDPAAQAALAAQPGFARARALFECDMVDDASAEWSAALAGATPAAKIQAAHLAARWGWFQQTIVTLAQAGDWDDVALRYPRPYERIVTEAAKQTHVPGDWILAVMRQESLFRRDAVSRADARGLMQMQPATATAVARRWQLPAPAPAGLFDPSVAVPMGAYYLRELLDKYQGQLDQTLAAYNAGPMSVARWLPRTPMDADVWIENIPYNETRAYVQHILEHIVAFAVVRKAEPPRIATLLPTVEPPPAAP